MDKSNPETCPRCGANGNEGRFTCWLCQLPFDQAAGISLVSVPSPPPHSERTFSLTSLLLLITLVSAFLGVFVAAPGLGIMLAVLSLPALFRTLYVVDARKHSGKALAAGQQVKVFIAALGTVVLAGVAAFVAFFGTCAIGCLGAATTNAAPEGLLMLMLIAGAGVGLVCAVLVMRAIWTRTSR